MQPFFGRAARELRKIETREKAAFAIEHDYLQFVAVIPDEIYLARETTEELRVLVLEPQPEHFGLGGRDAVHRFFKVMTDCDYIQPARGLPALFLL
jgi:hypothetical protein